MDEAERDARSAVVAAARSWLSTPYHHLACVKGHGVDCAYLVKATFEEARVVAPFRLEAYSAQWYLHHADELYLNHVMDVAREIPEAEALPGDIVLYQFGRCFSHGAIIIDPGFPKIVHAFLQARAVVIGEGDQGDLGFVRDGKQRPRRFFTCKEWIRG